MNDVFVALRAVRLGGILRRPSIASEHVLAMRDRLQMLWIYTPWITAQMVYIEICRDLTLGPFVSEAMGHRAMLTASPELTISVVI